MEAIAEKADLTVNWKNMKFDGIIPALQANQVDAAVSAIGIREDRLEGKTIVAKQGTASLELANELADKYNGEVTKLQDDATMYMEVENGNADVVINDYPSIAYKINQDGEDSQLRIVGGKYPSEDYGIAISKGSEDLVEKINAGLGELKDSGEFDELYNKYFSEE